MRPILTAQEITVLAADHFASLTLFARQWNAVDAEDIVQTVFLSLIQENHKRGRPENPTAWLYRSVRNEAVNRWRSDRRRKNREENHARPNVPTFQKKGDSSLDALEVADALDRLPSEKREIVLLRIWGGLSFDEIAGAVEKSRSTVFRLYRDGLEAMKTRLTK